MNEVFEKIVERLEELRKVWVTEPRDEPCKGIECKSNDCVDCLLIQVEEIVNQVAEEYGDGWIPCSKRLPEEAFGCLVTVMDCEPMTMTDFPNILPYHVGYDGETWNDGDGEVTPFEVLAWKPLPEPYQPK